MTGTEQCDNCLKTHDKCQCILLIDQVPTDEEPPEELLEYVDQLQTTCKDRQVCTSIFDDIKSFCRDMELFNKLTFDALWQLLYPDAANWEHDQLNEV